MAKTLAELRTQVTTDFPDNNSEEISELDFRNMFSDLIDKIEESRWEYIEDTLTAAETYASESFNGVDISQLIVIVAGQEQSTRDMTLANNELTFASQQDGFMKILIRPKKL